MVSVPAPWLHCAVVVRHVGTEQRLVALHERVAAHVAGPVGEHALVVV
jgi:hypothetical protein